MPRPKPDVALVPVLLRLHPETVAELDRLRGDVPRSKWITVLVNLKLASLTPPLPQAEVGRVMRKLAKETTATFRLATVPVIERRAFNPQPKPGVKK